jgi:hypothetical protein
MNDEKLIPYPQEFILLQHRDRRKTKIPVQNERREHQKYVDKFGRLKHK